jgi:hypothetical protein
MVSLLAVLFVAADTPACILAAMSCQQDSVCCLVASLLLSYKNGNNMAHPSIDCILQVC